MTVAVVGCGYWGRNLVRNFSNLGAIRYVCDATEEGRATATLLAPDAEIVSNLSAVLASDVAGIVIATPAETHYGLVKQALEADKDVFVEKPLALTYEQGHELVQLAVERERMLMVGHVLEYHPAITRILDLIQSGQLGKILYIYSNRLSLGKIRREENILWSFAPHDVAVILRIIGSLPFQVVACGGNYIQPNIADVTVTNLLFDNGVRAHIHVSWLHPFKEQRLVVIGSKRMASFDDVSKQLVLYDQRVEWQEGEPVPIKGKGESIEFDGQEPLQIECQAFLEAIATRRPPLTDGQSGLRVLRVLQASQRSLVMNGEPITLPVETFYTNGAALIHLWNFNMSDKAFFVHPSSYVDEPCEIGAGTKIWHFCHIMPNSKIGEKCILGQNVLVANDVMIGNNVKIQNNVALYTGVELEDDVFCGPSCVFTNVMNPRSQIARRDQYKRTRVRRGATIGANATIMCGSTLGRYAFIGAGAVVRGDVPDYALMVGVPAVQKGWMSRHGHRLTQRDSDGYLICPGKWLAV